jgi:WD40 repeat protein
VISNLPHDFGFGYELSRDGRWLITTGAEGFRQWELPKHSAIARPFLQEQTASVRPIAFDEKTERVLMLRGDKSLEVRSTETGELWRRVDSLAGNWSWGEFGPNEKLAVLVGRGPNAQTKPTPEEERLGICQIEGGNYVWDTPRDVQVVNLDTGRPLTPVLSHPAVSYAMPTPDGKTLIVIGNVMEHEKDAQGETKEYRSFAWLHFWDIATGRLKREPLKLPEMMTFLGFDPAEEHAIVAYDIPIGRDQAKVEIQRYRLTDWQKVQTIAEMTPGQEDTLTISPDRKLIAWGMPKGQVAVCDLATGKLSSQALGHPDWAVDRHREVARLEFSPDSRRLASATSWPEAEIRVWDIATGNLIGQPLAVGDLRTQTLAFSADGSLLASVFFDEFRVWDVNQGLPAIPRVPLPKRPKSAPGRITYRHDLEAVRFTPDGQRLLLAGRYGLSALELTPDNRPTETLERWAAILAGYRINRQGAAAILTREDFAQTWDRLK